MSDTRPSRRAVVAAAAWSAPVVVVAAAAPAHAASTGGSAPTFSFGTSFYSTFSNPQGTFYDLNFRGVSLTTSSAVPAGKLVLTISFRPDQAWTSTPKPGLNGIYFDQAPAGWTASAANATQVNSVALTYGSSLASGATLVIPNAPYVGTTYQTSSAKGLGFFDVTVSVEGRQSTVASLATPSRAPA